MKFKLFIISIFVFHVFSWLSQTENEVYKSENLIIQQLTEKTFVHISFLKTEDYGNVACNVILFIDDRESFVFDTTADDATSKELIDWLNNTKMVKIKGVIVTHFHDDCLGRLKEFHKANIASYAFEQTNELAKAHNLEVPKTGLNFDLGLEINAKKVRNLYFGKGYNKDNIVSYIPIEKVLFGGCLRKTIGTKKGYLGNANIEEWSNTVTKIKNELPCIANVIPRHGKTG